MPLCVNQMIKIGQEIKAGMDSDFWDSFGH